MSEPTSQSVMFPDTSSGDMLTEILRAGAQRMLAQAIEAEVADWIGAHAGQTSAQGHRQVVRNG